MQTVQAATASIASHSRSAIRWGRVIAAGVLSDIAVFAALFAAFGAYRLVAPGESDLTYQTFDERAAYYVAPASAGIATFLLALWAAWRAGARPIAHGVLVGVVAVLLSVGFIFLASPGDRPMYLVSFALRLVGGYAGGVVARKKRFQTPSPPH